MEIKYEIIYEERVVSDDIPKLSTINKKRIQKAVEQKLSTEPETYGKPLRRSLKGYRKLRVGDYRVIYRIERRVIKIFVILHRSVVYKESEKRNKS